MKNNIYRITVEVEIPKNESDHNNHMWLLQREDTVELTLPARTVEDMLTQRSNETVTFKGKITCVKDKVVEWRTVT